MLVRPPLRVERLWTVPSEASDHLPLAAEVLVGALGVGVAVRVVMGEQDNL